MGRLSMLPTVSSTQMCHVKDQTIRRNETMEANRKERSRIIQDIREDRVEEERRHVAQGNQGDVDFFGLVQQWREEHSVLAQSHEKSGQFKMNDDKICVCVRKRPLNDKERIKKEHDAVTCLHPIVTVHSSKFRVDGINKYLDNNSFQFDHAFDEDSTTEDVYLYTTKPLISYVCSGRGVRATVFAYGQTGSGKTFTMGCIQKMVAEDIFSTLANNSSFDDDSCSLATTTCYVAIFEIYSGRIQDLLNNRNRLKILEDGKGEGIISGLKEFEVNNAQNFLELIDKGHSNRTTHATEANEASSRSHSICQILFRDTASKKLKAKLSLVDLAGSERGNDTKSHNRQRRTESSEINTSLLALKECIRAIDGKCQHVPYRQSKLTLILKDCFVSKLAKTAMIATLSPGSSSTDHTINTLRYADRIKEQVVGDIHRKETVPQRSPVTQNQSKKSPVQNHLTAKQSPTFNERDDYNELNNCSNGQRHDTCNLEEIAVRDELSEFDQTVKVLLEEEEHLLNLHMTIIAENAELLTEESKLLQSVQGDEYDVEEYASRLEAILKRKYVLIESLRRRVQSFQELLKEEEELSKRYENEGGYSSVVCASENLLKE